MTYLFNHDLHDCSDPQNLDAINGIWKYSGRALCLSQEGDVVMLSPNLQKHASWIFGHYERVGLPVTGNIVWDDSFDLAHEILAAENDQKLSVFYYGDRAHAITNDRKWFDIVHRMNGKNEFIAYCQDIGVLVPGTVCFSNKGEFFDYQSAGKNGYSYPCYMKPSRSVSAIGIKRVDSPDVLLEVLSGVSDVTPFQLQAPIDNATFCNVQYVNGIGVVTEQVLDNMVHAGNRYPIQCTDPQRILAMTDPLAKELVVQGMKGVFAFDVAVVGEKIFAVECNPRFNGGTYPYVVARRLAVPCWVSENFKTSANTFEELDQQAFQKLEFSHEKGEGIVVFNWGTIEDQKIGVLIIGDIQAQNRIREELKALL